MKLLGDFKLKKYIGHHPLWLVDGVIFIGTFLLLLGRAVTDWPISSDGTRYLTYAKSMAGETNFYYYDGYLPPLYPFLTYLVHQVFPGTWEIHGRLISVFSGSFLVTLVFRFVRKLVDLRAAFISVLMLISYRLFLKYGAETQTESLFFLLMLIHVILVYKIFIDSANLKYWFGLIVTSVFLLLTRGSGVLIILWSMAVLTYPLFKTRRNLRLLGIVLGVGVGVALIALTVFPDIVHSFLKMATRIDAFNKTFFFFARDGYYGWLINNVYEKHPTIWTGLAFLSGMGIFKSLSSQDKKQVLFGFLLVSLMLYLVVTAGSFYNLIHYIPFYVRYNIPAGILAVLLAGFGIIGLADQVVGHCFKTKSQSKPVARLVWSGVAIGSVCICFFLDSRYMNVAMLHRLRAGKIVNEYRVAGEWLREHYPGETFFNTGREVYIVPYYANVYLDRPVIKSFDSNDPSQDNLVETMAINGYKFVVIHEEVVRDNPGFTELMNSTLWENCTEQVKRFDFENPSPYVNHTPITIYRWLAHDECQ